MRRIRQAWTQVRSHFSRLKKPAAKIWKAAAAAGTRVFGKLSWQGPEWPRELNARRKQLGRKFYYGLGAVALLLVIAGVAEYLYSHRLRPVLTTVAIDAPGITPASEPLTPDGVTVHFSLDNIYAAKSDSAARLDLIGKPVSSGIILTPAVPGEWRWSDDNTLHFTPQKDWPAGQRYTLSFDKSIFAPGVLLEDSEFSFSTQSMDVTLQDLKFYQDPVNPKIHEVVATLSFPYAVDAASLEKHVSLGMRPSGATINILPSSYKFKLTYDKLKREAYVTSDSITLPDQENYMTLTVSHGVKDAGLTSESSSDISKQVLIPDVRSFFRVDSLSNSIVADEQGTPYQTLVINFTDGVKAEDLAKVVHAYLLPGRDRSWEPREITADVYTKSQVLRLEPVSTENDYSALQSFRFDAPEGRQVYVRIDAGLVSHGEYVMSHFYDAVMAAPRYPKQAAIQSEGAVLSLSGSRKLSFVTRGVPAIRVQLGQLLPADIAHMVSQTGGNFSDPYFNNSYGFNENDITSRSTRIITLDSKSPRDAVYASLDLSAYLPHDSTSRGMFFITVDGWDPDQKRPIREAHDHRFILVSDMALVVKDDADASHDVFVQSIGAGIPVEGAQVELLGRNGEPALSAVTDAGGHAHLPATNNLSDEKQPTVYLVHRGADYAFIPFERSDRQINLSNFDIGGEYNDPLDATDALHAFVFSDRGIYRPGDTAHFGFIVKRRDWGQVNGVPVLLEVTNPGDVRVASKKVALGTDGFVDFDYTPDASAPTGDYHASVYLLGDKDRERHLLGSSDFKVEEFQPDSLRIHSQIEDAPVKGWMLMGKLEADVHLENLFGTAAQQRRVTASYSLTPTAFHFDAYPNYQFDDPFLDPESTPRTVSESLPQAETDDKGDAHFEMDLGQYTRGMYRLSFDTEGFEAAGGRSVSSANSVLVSPLGYLVGHRADGSLGWIDKGADRHVSFQAVDPRLKAIPLKDLTLKLSEERYVSTLVQQRDGTYRYQSVRKISLLKSSAYALPAKGADYRLPTDTAGDYIVELYDKDNDKLAVLRFTVAGARNATAALEKNAELKVDLKGHDYKPGDDIEMQIAAPYTGAGLITIERDKVFAYKWFKTDSTVSVQHIRVPEEVEGNAYVNVTFVRSMESKEIFTSPLSYAVQPFSVDRGSRSIGIKLDTPTKIEPGKPLTVDYDTTRAGRIVLFAVDEGILQVAHYRTPQPLDDFFQKRALQVETSQTADLILPEYELLRQLAGVGGDEAAKRALGRNLNPFRRRTEAPVAYWSGIISTDGGPGHYTFQIPDYFNGDVRVMAVAVSDGALGSADAHTLVRGPFVITPNVLTSVAPGDEFDVGVVLSNNLEGDARSDQVTLEAQPSTELSGTGAASLKLKVAPGSETKASFRFKVNGKLGGASILFTARGGGAEAHLTSTLSVRPATEYYTLVHVDAASGSAKYDLKRRLYPEFSQQQAEASSSPLIMVRGLEHYIAGYPYGCSEQIVSKVFPFLGFANDPVYQADLKQLPRDYDALITKLRARQQSDGGFAYWPGETQSAEFTSLYVLHFLTDAKEQGYAVPPDMLNAGIGYMQQLAGQDPQSMGWARIQAYAIYLLTRNGMVTTNYLTHLQEYLQQNDATQWRGDLAAVYMAASYRMLKQDDLANDLIKGYQEEQDASAYYSWYDTSLGRNAQYLYLLARHFPERLKNLPDSVLGGVLDPVIAGDYNTLSSAYAIIAFGAYGKSMTAMQQGHIDIGMRDAGGKATSLASVDGARATAELPLSAARVDFASRGIAKLFFTVTQAGFDNHVPAKEESQGLEVTREYQDASGKTVESAPLGAELTVHLRVRTTDSREVDNVALLDLLPGGFEVERDSLRGAPEQSAGGGGDEEGNSQSNGEWNPDYADIREDRVVFYGAIGPQMHEIVYKVKVTSPGKFLVPPAYAGAMYDHTVFAHSAPGSFEVSDVK